MNNKDQLQKELLEKVKKGIKPSDLKKTGKNISQKEDEAYISDNNSTHSIPAKSRNSWNKNNPSSHKTIQQLEQERNFEAKKAQNYLQELQKLMAEFDSKDLEIKELKKIKPTKTQQE